MNAADRPQLLRALHDRRETIAESWYKALTSTNSFIPLEAVKVGRHLVELTEQVIALLLTEPFEHGKAREIGAALARLRYAQPEALGRTLEVLACQLVQGLPADQAVALQPRLAALLGGLAAGFFQQAREIILTGQEQIRDALISEILRTEEALRRSEETAQALLNAPTDSALLLDPDGTIVALNEAAAESLGRSASELVGTYVFDLFPPDVAEHRKNRHAQVIRLGKPARYEDEREGRWFDNSIYPVFDAEGKVVQLAIFARDITERKQAEEALRESEERYRSLFERVPIGLYRTTPEGQTLDANPALVQMMGYPDRETLLAINTADGYVNAEDQRRWQAVIEQKGIVHDYEAQWYRRDGTAIWVRDTARAVQDDEGQVLYYEGIVEDVTEHKRTEQRMRQSERLAAMGWLAAALAHEINNPLQAIRTNLELVLDFDLEPDEHKEYLHVVSQEIQRLTEVARRVLDFAQPADDTRYPVPIAHLIQETLKLMGKQLQLARIQATTDLPADLPSVFVAPDQILQVLLNLSVNAIEAMPDGGHLHIAARADENIVELALTNDGSPIPAEHIERIFDPFFTTKPDGAGLGLSISHSIVQRHGGTISVKNLEDRRGVTFTITLPIARLGKEQEVVA